MDSPMDKIHYEPPIRWVAGSSRYRERVVRHALEPPESPGGSDRFSDPPVVVRYVVRVTSSLKVTKASPPDSHWCGVGGVTGAGSGSLAPAPGRELGHRPREPADSHGCRSAGCRRGCRR